MKEKISWYEWFASSFKEFVAETSQKPHYNEIVDVFECSKTGAIKAVVKYAERHTQAKNISEIVMDNEIVESLDPKVVRALTYMATLEGLKPEYSIVAQHMASEVDEFLLEIKSKFDKDIIKKSPSDISKIKDLISKFDPVDANRIGYLAGVRETVKEYTLRQKMSHGEGSIS